MPVEALAIGGFLLAFFGIFRAILYWYITEVHNDPTRSEDAVVLQGKAQGHR